MRKKIIAEFPDTFERYVEVFGGAGWVLFGLNPSRFEVFNDINGDLVNLYRCVKHHCTELQRELDGMLNSREHFFDCVSQMRSKGLTDIQRAARYFIMIRHSFGSNLYSFATDQTDDIKAVEYLTRISERLRRTIIEHEDFERLIKTYDRPGTLFYLDPPYHKTERYYDAQFTEQDHIRLRSALDQIKGKFVLSYNNDDFIKELYRDYKIKEVSRFNNLPVANDTPPVFNELIIKNY